mgnify:CR=1 FL=1
MSDEVSSVSSRSVSSRVSETTSCSSATSDKSDKVVMISRDQAIREQMQQAMGIVDGCAPPDMDFVKSVTMVVKIVQARIANGSPLYMVIFTENNYHIKDFLERVQEIEGLGEMFPVPCKFSPERYHYSDLKFPSS